MNEIAEDTALVGGKTRSDEARDAVDTPPMSKVVKKSPTMRSRSRRSRVAARSAESDRPSPLLETGVDTETEGDTSVAVGSKGQGESTSATTGRLSTRRSRVPRPRIVVAGLLIIAVLVSGTIIGWQMYEDAAVDRASRDALDTAKNYAVTLTTVDSTQIDQNFTDVLAGATGEFKDMYSRSSNDLKQMLIDNNASSKGNVIDAAVKSATENRVVVLLFVDQSITNSASPEPRVDRSRVVMTLDKVDGRWLAGKVELP